MRLALELDDWINEHLKIYLLLEKWKIISILMILVLVKVDI